MRQTGIVCGLLAIAFCFISLYGMGQTDSIRKRSLDSIILKQKGLVGRLAQNLLVDTMVETMQGLFRTDLPFRRYRGMVIRNIRIETREFEITDSSKKFTNQLKRLSDQLHRKSRDFVIHNHLF